MSSGLRKPLRSAVFISGSGSTLQALLEMQHQFEVSLVISNRSTAQGLKKAKRFGKKCHVLDSATIDYSKLHQLLADHKIDRIFLAGFMKILPAQFVELWRGRIMNIHPSLLPLYPGQNSAFRNWKDQSKMGATIHHVTAEMDQGPLYLQRVSLEAKHQLDFSDSEIFLRSSEQHLLRELTMKWIL